MTEVLEDKKETNTRFNKEIEAIRLFHKGPLKQCTRCHRLVFHPCRACEAERNGRVSDPLDTEPVDWDELRIELPSEERQRYEYIHLQKVMAETAKEKSLKVPG